MRDPVQATIRRMGTIGSRLRLARQAAKFSLLQAGDAAGVSKQAISQIERGVTKNPEAATLEPLCRKLGVRLHWLMTGNGPMRLNESDSSPANKSESVTGPLSHPATLDPDILHEALTLLLFDIDNGGKRTARTATPLLMKLYARIQEAGGRLPAEEQEAFEQAARARGQGKLDDGNELSRRRAAKRRRK